MTMDNTTPNHTTENKSRAQANAVAASTVQEVAVEPINREIEKPVIPPNRRISWLGWLVAIAIFILNRKLGFLLMVGLIVFKQFPTLNLKNLPGKAGQLYRNFRS